MIWPDHAERTRRAAGKGVLQLVRPARVIKKVRGDDGQIHVARFLDGLAAVHGFEHGQFARLFLDDARDAIKIFAALASGHFAPDFFVSAPRGLDRDVHVLRIAERDFGELVFGGRIDGVKMFARMRRDEFAVDEQFVSRRDDVIFGFLRRGRVIPFVAELQAAIVERNDGRVARRADGTFGGKFDGLEFDFHGSHDLRLIAQCGFAKENNCRRPRQPCCIFAQKDFAIFAPRIDNLRRRTKARSSATWPKTGSSPPSFDFYERVTFCTHRSRHPTGGVALRLGARRDRKPRSSSSCCSFPRSPSGG